MTALGRYLGPIVLFFGIYQLAQGLFMVVDPQTFFDEVGPWAPYNEHYIGDNATWSLALGASFVVAWRSPAWRVPLLAFAALQFGLHAINHLIDINEAQDDGIAVFDFVALVVVTLGLAGLTVAARRAETAP